VYNCSIVPKGNTVSTEVPTTDNRDQAGEPAGLTQEQVDALIAEGRARIDALDDQIIALVRARLEVSRANQKARINAGGGRVAHGRELEIMNHYADELGRPGGALALALLEFMRTSAT
jgi:chorismate mutase